MCKRLTENEAPQHRRRFSLAPAVGARLHRPMQPISRNRIDEASGHRVVNYVIDNRDATPHDTRRFRRPRKLLKPARQRRYIAIESLESAAALSTTAARVRSLRVFVAGHAKTARTCGRAKRRGRVHCEAAERRLPCGDARTVSPLAPEVPPPSSADLPLTSVNLSITRTLPLAKVAELADALA